MNKEEIEETIDQLTKVRPEVLNDEALKLYNTIMKIIDERDKLIEENQELKIQRDYYKREYSLYNKTIEEAGKVLTKKR